MKLTTRKNPMPRRQTSSKVSTIAGRVLRECRAAQRARMILVPNDLVSVAELKALSASVLAQDEVKGQKKAKRKAKRRRA
jgi:hypothetical protein